ncbi:c-Myc-binding protein homolog [Anastrepha obliqua]|uniref:c-Myc-binding protein homolog n=1 Tax=Anastrepha obliqua TaxID=95512 RepID=UPI002408FF6B|nr:c-Myc-binding protein homolog [Anastrepha obliqua]
MAFKPIDPKRDEFRRYLERSGVIEALTKVFVRIANEHPENPLDYLRHNLGDSLHQADSVAYLQSELEEARSEIQRLRGIIESVHPEALLEQPQLREVVDKNNEDAASENQEVSSDSVTKPQEESETSGRPGSGAPQVPNVDNIQQDDLDKNLETPDDSSNTNNPMPTNAAQNVDNNS